jgi:peptidoglycan/xylan/chitin deacetylase (PgdA/CDA1 family)
MSLSFFPAWPGNAAGAVSLTYDDGSPDNLDFAIPDLEEAGFRGTFYLYKSGPAVQRIGEWREAFANGHEIGNHTVRHPCRNDAKPRVQPLRNALENYTPLAIADEVREARDWLDTEIGQDPGRTFAYPCGNTAIGCPPDEESYRAAVAACHPAARSLRREINHPASLDLMRLGAFMYQENRLDEFLEPCRCAVEEGGWAILVFHSIDGGNHGTSRHVHRELLVALRKMPLWVAPVRDVLLHTRASASPGTNNSPGKQMGGRTGVALK